MPSVDTSGAEFSEKTSGLDLEVALFLEAYMAALAFSSHVEGLPVWKATRLMQFVPCPPVSGLHLGTKQGLQALASKAWEENDLTLQIGTGENVQAYLTRQLSRIRDQYSADLAREGNKDEACLSSYRNAPLQHH